ncbi:hypothetical protein [Bifidobacterium aemilianum]|nr:hypothetical protein [Bifidobacterium aemilianum]
MIDFDLFSVMTSLAGPQSPQGLIRLQNMSQTFDREVPVPWATKASA